MEEIDMTPTWTELLPVLVHVAANGETAKGRDEAMGELKRLAQAVDKLNAKNKAAKAQEPHGWYSMTPSQQHDTIINMERYGGSFSRALAAAFRAADSDNTARLVGAFPGQVTKYRPR